ncbi:MAG: hypothetical protein LKE20_07170 [Limosilactobacillus oris]|jgi:hypothetical protein|nr:SPJ_0845 family protein [Limosilactobacillus oris]MCH3911885.1 hypothetical protein [Limosilactobacillus oris]MCH3939137.1 hypothetical protein [Limosilactobacillus oris]MCI1980462.1 hypothetical protein [Limosilactobacillus oris]MCI2042819.1 hypothetical protein [Limosilactobacillus oris]UXC67479.1 SPJ_0845 family protein [Limosilactobacillus oris]
MGLVTRRSEQLDRLFDQFAIDPKKKPAKKPAKDQEKSADKQDEKNK